MWKVCNICSIKKINRQRARKVQKSHNPTYIKLERSVLNSQVVSNQLLPQIQSSLEPQLSNDNDIENALENEYSVEQQISSDIHFDNVFENSVDNNIEPLIEPQTQDVSTQTSHNQLEIVECDTFFIPSQYKSTNYHIMPMQAILLLIIAIILYFILNL